MPKGFVSESAHIPANHAVHSVEFNFGLPKSQRAQVEFLLGPLPFWGKFRVGQYVYSRETHASAYDALHWDNIYMGFSVLARDSLNAFHKIFEVKMDIQIGIDADGKYVMVIAGRLALTIDEDITQQMANYQRIVREGKYDRDILSKPDGAAHFDEQDERMEAWIRSLPQSDTISPVPLADALGVLGFIHLGPIAPLPPTPWRPSFTYGHLPFHGICSGDEVFYRFESTSRGWRIDRATGEVKGNDIYAAPMSDLPLVPTGLSAVSRYALPSLLPARWRYELRPPAGTAMRYGASVPLYGQSGGGVEVMFPRPFTNVGHIADPVVLPIF